MDSENNERIRLEIAATTEDQSQIVLCYKNNGEAERQRLDLDSKDFDDNQYIFVISDRVAGLSSSYVDGLFRKSVQNTYPFGTFNDKYSFEMNDSNESTVLTVMRCIDNLYTEEFFDRIRETNNKKDDTTKKENKGSHGGYYIAIYLIILSIVSTFIAVSSKIIILAIINIPAFIIGAIGIIAVKTIIREERDKNEKTGNKD